MSRPTLLAALAGSLGLVLCVGTPALATAIYTYTGDTYTEAELPWTTSMSLSGSVTLASPLAGDLTDVALSFTTDILSFTFDTGVVVLTEADTILHKSMSVSTDSGGAITSWGVCFVDPVIDIGVLSKNGLDPTQCSGSDGDAVLDDGGTPAASVATVGSWAGPVPEPGTAALIGLGLVGLAVQGRRHLH